MPKFAANLSMLYQELPFLDRFGAAAQDGFRAVEYLFPYAFDAREIAARLHDHGLQQVLFNAPPGSWDAGERGIASLAGREAEFRASIASALEYAQVLGCPRVHAMAGLVARDADRSAARARYLERLAWAAKAASDAGVTILIEPINTRDIPGYLLNRQEEAHAIVHEIGAANLKVQMDLYHCQVVEGDVAMKIRQYVPSGNVGHVQIAGAPERHEPDVGEMHYPYLFAVLDECGYEGWVGCEYRPRAGAIANGTSAGLAWLRRASGGNQGK